MKAASLLLALALTALVLVPGASAGTPLTAASVFHEGEATTNGDLIFLHMEGNEGDDPWLRFEAASVHGWHFIESGHEAGLGSLTLPLATSFCPDQETAPECPPEAVGTEADPLTNVRAWMSTEHGPYFVRVFTLDGDQATFTADSSQFSETASERATLGSDGISSKEATQDDALDHEPRGLVRVHDGPAILADGQGDRIDLDLTGDLVIEIFGIDLVLEDAEGSRHLSTGYQTEEVASMGPAGATTYTQSLARLVLKDAAVHFTHSGEGGRLQWALAESQTHSETGPVILTDATGALLAPDGLHELDHEQIVHQGRYTLAATPATQRIDMDFQASEIVTTAPSASFSFSKTAFLAAAAVLLVGFTATLVYVRNVPTMDQVESAMRDGQYGKATRLSGRLLRHNPHLEAARLSRAIALSRSGQPQRVVDEVSDYLNKAAPHDGTLHYVLGLAYRDLGDEPSARMILREAIRLTPSLGRRIDADARGTDRTPNGGQQAYA